MTIMLIDNKPFSRNQLEDIAKELDANIIFFSALKPAYEYLEQHQVDGIVTAMEYAYREDDPSSMEETAGNILLMLLKGQNSNTPVLGSSQEAEFNKGINYAFYKGAMSGEVTEKAFKEFVSSIKDHN